MEFIGRSKEIGLLQSLRAGGESSMAVVYGRRRVGKSALISEAYANQKVYVFEGLEKGSSIIQIKNFVKLLKRHFPHRQIPDINNWHDALTELQECIGGESCVVVFDEFQWMSSYKQELISTLKLIWDQFLSKQQDLSLVLCGSVASFMVNKVIKSKAIYGRIHLAIHLKPFKLHETKLFLKGKSVEEVLLAQMLVGGIPGYLNLLRTKNSVVLGIQELAFEKHGYFTTEFERIFISQFGKSEIYQRIVRLLNNRVNGLTRLQIAEECKIKNGGTLSTYLSDLEMAGLISSYASFNSGPRAKTKSYRVTDSYLRLFLSFIEVNKDRIESESPGIFVRLSSSPAFYSWLGIACEIMCYEHRYELSKLMGFSDVEYSVGSYFDRGNLSKGVQIDLVYDRKDLVITMCEIKYQQKALGTEIISEMEHKANMLPNKKNKTIQKALIVRQPPTKEVLDSGLFAHIVQIDRLVES